ncbi:MAG: T9SS type A sorting domain-containing protein [Bacteroidia bacterium]
MRKIFTLTVLLFFIFLFSNAQIVPISPPYFNNFETDTTDWVVVNSGGSGWQWGAPNFGTTTGAHSGALAWDIELSTQYSNNSDAALYTPVFNFTFTTSAILSFWLNYNVEALWDGTRLEYTTNNGITWTMLGGIGGNPPYVNWYPASIWSSGLPAWTGLSSGWTKSQMINLGILPGIGGSPTVQFRFIFTSDATVALDGFSIDDFSISIPGPNDAGVTNVIKPYTPSAAGYSSPVSVQFTNFGNINISNFDVSYTLDGGLPVTQTYSGTLAPGASDSMDFPDIIVPSGTYTICTYTSMPADPDNSNDTMCFQLSGVVASINMMNFPDTTANPPCDIPFLFNDYIYGTASGLNITDSIFIYIAFGDGTDTSYADDGISFSIQVQHQYTFAGQFSIQYIATALNGTISDTITMYNQVILSDSCGTISGTIYFDANANCIFDTGDSKLNGILAGVSVGGNILYWDFTDTVGDYDFNVPTGAMYSVQLAPSNLYNTICPASGIYSNITILPSTGNDFALNVVPGYDLEPTISATNFRPNFNRTVFLTMHNNLFLPTIGELRFPVDTNYFIFLSASPPPSAIIGDTLIWNTGILSYNSGSFYASVDLFCKSTMQIGDTICVKAIAEPIVADSFPLNNIATTCRPVTNSIDPNDKSVTPGGAILSGTELIYTINFQNTGNDTAFNVFILDTIDASLDVSTMRILTSSHTMSTVFLSNNVIKFSFNNIYLPDSNTNEPSSHRNILFAIKPISGIPNGTTISNTAHIYFDFNPDVATNSTYNIISDPVGIHEPAFGNETFMLFPNPAEDHITLVSKNNSSGNLIIHDLAGKEVLRKNISGNKVLVDVKNITSGFYFVSMEQDGSVVRKKIIVMH